MPDENGYPTLTEVRAWLGVTTASISDDDLQVILSAEETNQARVCRIPEDGLPSDLYASLLRRCARECAARNIPLGVTGGIDEYGPTRLPSYDAEIERLERPVRIVVFG